MIFWLTRRLLGSIDYRVEDKYADDAARLLVGSGANYRDLIRCDGYITFTMPSSDGTAFFALCADHGIPIEKVRERGARYFLRKYRRRPGIFVGMLLFAASLIVSRQFIWDMKVVGNENVPSDEIIRNLGELGCGVGSFIPGIDFDLLHNEYLLHDDKLAWISVNVRGTVATVEVRELEVPERMDADGMPYNLVASENGLIKYVEILRGKPVVTEGALVKEGELLASGIEDIKHGFRLVHAEGSVIAEVIRNINVEIPLESSVRTATGQEYFEKSLNFFGITVKFFENSVNLPKEYDKIEKELPFKLFGVYKLPISIKETVYREYEYVPVCYTEKEAREIAFERLRVECSSTLEGCELVSREINSEIVDGVYKIRCRLTVHTDIARQAPIYTE